jgi:hypothetical protein
MNLDALHFIVSLFTPKSNKWKVMEPIYDTQLEPTMEKYFYTLGNATYNF